MKERAKKIIRRHHVHMPYAVWAVALVSMLGSLAMSEVMHLPPCVLCWWQRILIYPVVVIAGVAILRREKHWPYYVLPLTVTGAVMAFYHSLLQWKILPEAVAPCTVGVSCVTKQIALFGFVTIPFMSFLAFAAVTALALAYMWANKSLLAED